MVEGRTGGEGETRRTVANWGIKGMTRVPIWRIHASGMNRIDRERYLRDKEHRICPGKVFLGVGFFWTAKKI